MFVRDGGLVPLMQGAPEPDWIKRPMPLSVRHYGAAPGRFGLFDDDGWSHAYERDEYRWRTLEVSAAPDGTRKGTVSEVEDDWQSAYGDVTWEFVP